MQRPWLPPQSLWRLGALLLFTFGIYGLFWIGRTAGEIRARFDPETRGWRNVLGMVFPVVNWVFIAWFANRVQLFFRPQKEPSFLLSAAVAITFTAGGITSIWANRNIEDEQSIQFLLWHLGAALLVSIPFLPMQHLVNRYKTSLADAQFTSEPFKFTWPQVWAIVPGAALVVLAAYATFGEYFTRQGEPVSNGGLVIGASGFYRFTAIGENWVWPPQGTIVEDADTELYGRTTETYVVVYVDVSADYSLDDMVAYRRRVTGEELTEFTVTENRVIQSPKLLPISFATYQGKDSFGDEFTYYVVSFIEGNRAIEGLGVSTGNKRDLADLRSTLFSLGPTPMFFEADSPEDASEN